MSKKALILYLSLGGLVVIITSYFLFQYFSSDQDQSNFIDTLQSGEIVYLPGLTATEMAKLEEPQNMTKISRKNSTCARATETYQDYCVVELKYMQAMLLDDEVKCNVLTEPFNDRCYEVFAGKRNDLDLCNNIKNSEVQGNCLQKVITKVAVQKDDIYLCDQLDEQTAKVSCIDSLVYKHSIYLCDSDYILTNQLKDRCQSIILSSQAMLNNNPSTCQQIPLTEFREKCLSELGG